MTTCSVADCRGRSAKRGLCSAHYKRWRSTGVLGGPIRQYVSGTPEQRFWPKVNKAGPAPTYRPDLGPCWLWTAYLYKGYGRFNGGQGRIVEAHRFAYELAKGAIPSGLVLDHLCRVTSCVNPDHLEPVTIAENVDRGFEALNRPRRRAVA